MTKDSLGDRLKAIEQVEAGRRADRTKPLMARLDGKAFHTFTRGLQRPYDLTANPNAEFMYDGKIQKLTSVLASMAGGYFNVALQERIPEKSYDQTDAIQAFDCRVWNVDDHRDVYLNFLWRQDDAIKNSISMAAQSSFSHRQLDGVNSEDKKRMLREVGKPWEDHPLFFKMGTFVGRVTREVELTTEQLARIPEKHRPTGPVLRTFVEDLNIGYLKNEKPEVIQQWFDIKMHENLR